MTNITLPYNWKPRDYQMPFWRYMQAGGRRAVLVWHRRSGKDLTALNWAIPAMTQRVGLYWHLAPTYKQGRRIIWDGFTSDGRKFLDHFPKELIKSVRQDLMRVELVNGSIYQVVGTDDVDSLVGANPVGIIISEYSLQNPRAWKFIAPILNENGGWAVFVYTPRGRNHGFDMLRDAKAQPGWFAQVLTVDDTRKLTHKGDEVPLISMDMIQQDRETGSSEEEIQQEYWCSFDASLVGAYYADPMNKVLQDGRICTVPYDPTLPVHTAWDLGRNDQTAIWFIQIQRRKIMLIDYHESRGQSLQYYIKLIKEKPYIYGQHLAPHDIGVSEYSTGVSRIDFAKQHGVTFFAVPKLRVEEGIQGVRAMLPRCEFDAKKCIDGIEALRQYTKVYDEKNQVYKDKPKHDRSSDGSDAFRTLAVGLKYLDTRNALDSGGVRPTHALTQYDPRKTQQSVAQRPRIAYNPRNPW